MTWTWPGPAPSIVLALAAALLVATVLAVVGLRRPRAVDGASAGDRDHALTALVAEAFLARLGFGVVTFTLPFYALALGMSVAEIGLLASLRAVTALAAKPFAGHVADRLGVRRTYMWSIALRGVIGLLFVFASAPWMLFAIRALHGLSTAARDPTSALLIAERSETGRVARAFSWYATAKVAGAGLGYPLAGLLLAIGGDDYPLVFSVAALTSFLAWGVVGVLVRDAGRAPAEAPAAAANGHEGVAGGWMGFAGLALAVAIPASMIGSLFPVIATEWSGLSKPQVAGVLTAAQLAVIVAGPVFGWLADHAGRGLVLSIRSVANILSSFMYFFFPGLAGLAAARLVDDLGKAAFKPAWGAVMSDVAKAGDARRRGRIISYLDTAETIGEAIGPLLAGLLWQHGGIVWMLGARVALSICAEAYAIRLLGRR